MKIGDVKPSKILNIDKEESYDTYENKLIYTLIQNMKIFVSRKKKTLEQFQNEIGKNDRQFDYEARSQVGKEQVNINVSLNAKKTSQDAKNDPDSIDNILKRIENLEIKILDLTCNNVYKIIDKKHITLVRDPIKKTNVILKNVNFQYAMQLWHYLKDNIDDKTRKTGENKEYDDDTELKDMMDESFFINYLIINSMNKDNQDLFDDKEQKREMQNIIISKMLERVVEIDDSISQEEFTEMLGEKFAVIKYKKQATIKEIQYIFSKHIEEYLENIKKIRRRNVK
ncbi:MAG: hypothetical protein ACI4VE_05980 [Clostridia bacterium]